MNESSVLLSYAEVYHDDSFVDDKFRDALTARLRLEYGTAWALTAEGDGIVARGRPAYMLGREDSVQRLREHVRKSMLLCLVAQFVEARDEVHALSPLAPSDGQERLSESTSRD